MKLDSQKKGNTHTILSILITVIGLALMVFMITVESEPGAIPLLLIVIGIGWYVISRFRMRSQQT
ncbi:hypothetical protein [Fodinibius sp. Rm-B-1B1-1]|uniref:hypothetical protein n=1 Tax=Fodinibius alkaliphilus TaxID=3140241 RepID=UPI00315AB213